MLALSGGGQGPQGKKRRPKHHFSWSEHVLRLTEAEFKLRYRLDFDSFMELVSWIRSAISVSNEKQAKFAKWGQLVAPETKVAMALRYLAGGSPLDLKLIYDVSKSYVYHCLWLVVDAINEHYKVEFPIDDPEKLRTLEAEWRARARCPDWGARANTFLPNLTPHTYLPWTGYKRGVQFPQD